MAATDALVIFAKYPAPGFVKTRLGEAIGPRPAMELAAAFQEDAAALARGLAVERVWAYSPDHPPSRARFERLAGDGGWVWAQPEGSLGDRLGSCLVELSDWGFERVVVIGTDSPTLPSEYVQHAFRQLHTCDVVLGPATDGGYYLLGLRYGEEERPYQNLSVEDWPRSLFTNVAWSGPDVLRQTIENVRRHGRSLRLMPPWYDVDTLDDLQLMRRHLTALGTAGLTSPCPHTSELLTHSDFSV